MPEVGDIAPDFTLPSTAGMINLRKFNKDKKLVLAFYTEDGTPGWTDMLSPLIGENETLTGLGADLIGISADDVDTHWNFCESLGRCPYPLASDVELEVARLYDVLNDEGKRAKRAVFILDESGIILHKIPWYQPGNVGQLMEIFSTLGLES